MSFAPTSALYTIYSTKFQSFSRWVVLLVLWVIIFSIAIGKVGIANFIILNHEKNVLVDTVNALSHENAQIRLDIQNLKSSRILQERYLKQNFGYVEKDEFVVHISSTFVAETS